MTIQSPLPRSTLAETLLPAKGLFRRSTAPSRRAARERIALQIAVLPALLMRPTDGIADIATNIALVGAVLAAVWMLGEGLRAEDDWRARPAARRPRLPLKVAAGALMGLTLAIAFATVGNGIATSAAAGVLGCLLHLVAFGIDPLHDKHDTTVTAQDADRVEDITARANASLTAMLRTLDQCGAPDAIAEGARLDAAASALLSVLATVPAALPRSRRALTVWLPALAEAAARFAPLHLTAPDPARTRDVVAVIAQVRANIEQLALEAQQRADEQLSRDLAVLSETSG